MLDMFVYHMITNVYHIITNVYHMITNVAEITERTKRGDDSLQSNGKAWMDYRWKTEKDIAAVNRALNL
jgi:hypothetical protein